MMSRIPFSLAISLVFVLSACGDRELPPPGGEATPEVTLAFTGATLWDGTGAEVVENATLAVREGRVEAVGPAGSVAIPDYAERRDLTGHWIVPGLINAHGHLSEARGMESGASVHTRENILDQLLLNARVCAARTAGTTGSWPSPATVGGSVPPATHGAWRRWPRT